MCLKELEKEFDAVVESGGVAVIPAGFDPTKCGCIDCEKVDLTAENFAK